MTTRLATAALMAAALMSPAGCGGDGGSGKEPQAGGKVLRPAALHRCLKRQHLLVASHATPSGIDFTAYWRDGRNQADFGLEQGPEQAAAREDAWKRLAEQAHIDDAGAYYARYGNVVVGWERLPSAADRLRLERCLA
jgi:hypothetical protein